MSEEAIEEINRLTKELNRKKALLPKIIEKEAKNK